MLVVVALSDTVLIFDDFVSLMRPFDDVFPLQFWEF
jgi:hypothetical protein